MKKILLILLLVVPLFAQSVKDIYNSSTTALDTSAVFTGTAKDVSPYNSVSVSLWSDNAITLSVEFGDLVAGSFVARKYFIYSYSANDSTFTKSMPVVAPYFRVVATNGAVDSADVFNLVTQLHKGVNLPTNTDGSVQVSIAGILDSLSQINTTLRDTINTKITGVTLSADSLFIKPPTGVTSGTKSVTTSASVLATSADAQEVWIINDNESGVIYFGGSGVTTSNGVPIYPKMSAVVRTDNIADVYVIAASTLTARYLKVN